MSESDEEITKEGSLLVLNQLNDEIDVNKVHEECRVEVKVEDKIVKFEVDTSERVSIINENLYNQCLVMSSYKNLHRTLSNNRKNYCDCHI